MGEKTAFYSEGEVIGRLISGTVRKTSGGRLLDDLPSDTRCVTHSM